METLDQLALRIGQEADDAADAALQCKGEFHPDWHTVRDREFARRLFEAAGNQEPVGVVTWRHCDASCYGLNGQNVCEANLDVDLPEGTQLFAAPVPSDLGRHANSHVEEVKP